VLDEIEEGRLRPVEVVEDKHEGTAARERLEEPADGPERLVGGDLGLAEADEIRGATRDNLGVLFGPDERSELRARPFRRLRVVEAGRLLERLGERPERNAVPVGQAASAHDANVGVE
jgi:hypothetical protein